VRYKQWGRHESADRHYRAARRGAHPHVPEFQRVAPRGEDACRPSQSL